MVRLGRMTEAEAQRNPQRNLLVRSVGTQPVVKVDRLPIELVGGDSMLTLDGLHSYFATPSELVETVGRGNVEQLPGAGVASPVVAVTIISRLSCYG